MQSKYDGGILESNRLAGTRLELLLFHLNGSQLFGINVFKVQEVIPYQSLTRLPGAHPLVEGIATLRGKTMSIIDLSRAVGGPRLNSPESGNIIITEYNRSVHGFLVRSVARIVNTQWEKVQPRPGGVGRDSYMTAVTLINGSLVEILDVEKVLDQVIHTNTHVSENLASQSDGASRNVLVVDDSLVARNQISKALEQIGVQCTTAEDGKHAMDILQGMLDDGVDVCSYFMMVISDIEMPKMDGYMLTTAIRSHSQLNTLYILLHSSISGVFNVDMVEKTGANRFIQKYSADDLAASVLKLM